MTLNPDPLAVPWPDDFDPAPDMGLCPVCQWAVGDVAGHVRLAHAGGFSSDHAVLLARARRAKLAQSTAFLVGLALGAAAGVVVVGVWLR